MLMQQNKNNVINKIIKNNNIMNKILSYNNHFDLINIFSINNFFYYDIMDNYIDYVANANIYIIMSGFYKNNQLLDKKFKNIHEIYVYHLLINHNYYFCNVKMESNGLILKNNHSIDNEILNINENTPLLYESHMKKRKFTIKYNPYKYTDNVKISIKINEEKNIFSVNIENQILNFNNLQQSILYSMQKSYRFD